VVPACAVPVKVGVLSFVRSSELDEPVSLAAVRSGAEIAGVMSSTAMGALVAIHERKTAVTRYVYAPEIVTSSHAFAVTSAPPHAGAKLFVGLGARSTR